jgi:hypothetical protein
MSDSSWFTRELHIEDTGASTTSNPFCLRRTSSFEIKRIDANILLL